jgi:hypothetical protein
MKMEENTLYMITIVSLAILVGYVTFGMESVKQEIKSNTQTIRSLDDGLGRMKMYGTRLENLSRTNGVYVAKGYYCVWTKNRTEEEILRTDCHERYHAMIHKNYDHFCRK